MSDKTRLIELCKNYTDYTDRQIQVIVDKARALDELAEIFDCDIFIDVPLINSISSIVVYHVHPTSKDSLYGQSPIGQLALKMNEPGVWRVSRTGGKLRGHTAITQEDVLIRQDIYSLDDESQVLGVYIFERSFKEIEQANKDQAIDYITIMAQLNNYIDDAIYLFDVNGKLIFQNDIADGIFEELPGENMYYGDLFGDQVPYSVLETEEHEKTKQEIQIAGRRYTLKRVLLKDDKLDFAIILRDITLLKNKEAEIISKTEAIRETHHRIKNNLQTMASLLRMERRRSDSDQIKEILTNNMNRVMSIAATHDILARKLGEEVDLNDVLRFIINHISRSYSTMDHIELIIEARGSVVAISDIATTVSLIVNELVQNSYDHAFPNQSEGKILVSVKKEEDDVVLSVSDNGIGFDIDEVGKNSLGLTIVQSYVKDQLNGSIQFNKTKSGMETILRFNPNKS